MTSFLHVPVVIILLSLVFLSLFVRKCLSKVAHHSQEDTNCQMNTPCAELKLIQNKKGESVEELIISENKNLGAALKIMNIEGCKAEATTVRREANKFFIDCLTKIKPNYGSALLWLKRNISIFCAGGQGCAEAIDVSFPKSF